MKPFSWTCEYCGQATTITDQDFWQEDCRVDLPKHALEYIYVVPEAICCPNPECNELSLSLAVHEVINAEAITMIEQVGNKIRGWQLLPQSHAKPLPGYIPKAIRDDYLEACLILDLSPKASAALARRCLQGMIRNFHNLTKAQMGMLNNEINHLETILNPRDFEALHHVREIGNIGAHMEKDVDLIIEITPEEAKVMIGLLETLFEDWYIDRHKRAERLKKLADIAVVKKQAKKTKKPAA